MNEKIERILRKWGWTYDELMDTLQNGGSSMNPVMNISAGQCAHEIIKELLKDNPPSSVPPFGHPPFPNTNTIELPQAPYGKPLPTWEPKRPLLPNEPVGQCTRCGRDLFAVDMYSCPRMDCPTQPRVTM